MIPSEKIFHTADHDVLEMEQRGHDDHTSYELHRGAKERGALVGIEDPQASMAREVFQAAHDETESPRSRLVRLDWEREHVWHQVKATGGATPPMMEALLRQNLLDIA